MEIQFEIFIVTKGGKNLYVSTVFNDAFREYLESPNSCVEVWKEGTKINSYKAINDFCDDGRVIDYRKKAGA